MRNIPKPISHVFPFFCIAILFTGCMDTILYTPTNLPTNLTKKSGEIYVQAAAGSNGLNFIGGFSPGEHFQVAVAYSQNTKDEENETSKRISQEYMVGYYNQLEYNVNFEAFLGVATGTSKTKLLQPYLFSNGKDTVRHEGEFNKFFLQLNVGMKKGWMESGLAVRCTQLNYTNVEKIRNSSVILYKGSPKAVLWEPVVFGRIGNENFKITVMAGFPYIPGVKEISYQGLFLSTGVGLNFSL